MPWTMDAASSLRTNFTLEGLSVLSSCSLLLQRRYARLCSDRQVDDSPWRPASPCTGRTCYPSGAIVDVLQWILYRRAATHPFLKRVNRAGKVFFLARSPLAPSTTTDNTSLLAIKHFTSSRDEAEEEHGRCCKSLDGILLCPFNPRAPKMLLIFSTLSIARFRMDVLCT